MRVARSPAVGAGGDWRSLVAPSVVRPTPRAGVPFGVEKAGDRDADRPRDPSAALGRPDSGATGGAVICSWAYAIRGQLCRCARVAGRACPAATGSARGAPRRCGPSWSSSSIPTPPSRRGRPGAAGLALPERRRRRAPRAPQHLGRREHGRVGHPARGGRGRAARPLPARTGRPRAGRAPSGAGWAGCSACLAVEGGSGGQARRATGRPAGRRAPAPCPGRAGSCARRRPRRTRLEYSAP